MLFSTHIQTYSYRIPLIDAFPSRLLHNGARHHKRIRISTHSGGLADHTVSTCSCSVGKGLNPLLFQGNSDQLTIWFLIINSKSLSHFCKRKAAIITDPASHWFSTSGAACHSQFLSINNDRFGMVWFSYLSNMQRPMSPIQISSFSDIAFRSVTKAVLPNMGFS